jgi:hypothetical protein
VLILTTFLLWKPCDFEVHISHQSGSEAHQLFPGDFLWVGIFFLHIVAEKQQQQKNNVVVYFSKEE